MNWTARFRTWWRGVTRREQVEREMHAEIGFHLEQYADDLVRNGTPRVEAERQARIEFGALEAQKEECRASLGLRVWDELRGDAHYATRMLRKNPGTTAIATLTLAIGIGATTAIFSIVDAAVLRPLPYAAPERLVALGRRYPDGISQAISVPNFSDWSQQGSRVFENTSAYDILLAGFNMTNAGTPERLAALHVSANFFQTLGIRPEMGRVFAPDEDQVGHDTVVMLSHRLWEQRFGSDPGIVGRALELNGRAYTVIGILPAQFSFIRDADVWAPLVLETTSQDRKANVIEGLARLRPGVTPAAAQAEMDVVAKRLQRAYPEDNKNIEIGLVPLQRKVVGDLRTPMLVLLAAVTMVLLVACANVANLLLAQAAGRQREIALRAALGARRMRIARQLLTESVVLAFVGAAAGLVLAHWATAGLLALSPVTLPLLNAAALDGRVLLFAVGITLATAIAFGCAPAIQALHLDLNEVLKKGGRSGSSAPRQRLRAALVISEVALALVLSVGAGLLIESFTRLLHVDPGFDAEHVLNLRLPLSDTRFQTGADLANYFRKFLPQVESLPGVSSAAVVTTVPLQFPPDFPVNIVGRSMPEEELPDMIYVAATSDLFSTLRIPLKRGRGFTDADNENSAPVVVISESAARRWWPDGNAIGQHIWIARSMGPQFADKAPREIVGIAADVHNDSLRDRPRATTYVPIAQVHAGIVPLLLRLLPLSVVVRTFGDPLAAAAEVKKQIWAVDAQQPITDVRPLQEAARRSLTMERFVAWLLGGFGGLALLLSAGGIYGLISYSVSQRSNEIGVRMALGAPRGRILRMVVGDGLRLTVIGVAAGVALALGLTRSMQALLFGVKAWDAAIYSSIAVLLAAVAAVASFVPARRAAKVDPMVALRYE